MPPSASKANYKTYEAQARMVRAIVAAHPEVKWNFKGKRRKFLLYHTQASTNTGPLLGRYPAQFLVFARLETRRLTVPPEIVACYGSDMTDHALQHRFRRLRAQSTIIREARLQKLDMKNMERDDNSLPKSIDAVDKQSTLHHIFLLESRSL